MRSAGRSRVVKDCAMECWRGGGRCATGGEREHGVVWIVRDCSVGGEPDQHGERGQLLLWVDASPPPEVSARDGTDMGGNVRPIDAKSQAKVTIDLFHHAGPVLLPHCSLGRGTGVNCGW
jgi:hypothetical protein